MLPARLIKTHQLSRHLKPFPFKSVPKIFSIARHFSSKYGHLNISEVANLPSAKISKLPNGIRVISERIPQNHHTATIGVYIQAGSRFETPENNGCAHFLEHLAFKGTAKRSKLQLEKEVENMGGHLNAYTSREQTTYYATVQKEYIPRAVDILADILQNSRLNAIDIESERDTILTEAKEVYKDQEEYIFDYLHEVAYLKDPLGQTILGPTKNIKKLSRDDLQNYIRRYYTPQRIVISGAGDIDHNSLVKIASEKFSAMKPSAHNDQYKPARYMGGDYRELQDEIDMAHIAIAFETCGWNDPDTFPLLIMNALIGNWEENQAHGAHNNSRLVSTISAYRYGNKLKPFNTLYGDTGLFGIYVSAYESRLWDVSNCVMSALRELSSSVTDKQVDEAKNQLLTASLMGMESSSQLCEELGRQMLAYGRKIPITEWAARINAVDANAVKNAAMRFIVDKDLSISAVGSITELPPYIWFRRRTYSLTE